MFNPSLYFLTFYSFVIIICRPNVRRFDFYGTVGYLHLLHVGVQVSLTGKASNPSSGE